MLRQKRPSGKRRAPPGLTGNRNMLFGLERLVTGASDAD
jgi:hypothetical protein